MDFIESVPHGKEHFLNETSLKETSEEVEIQTPTLDDIYSCLSLIMLLSLFHHLILYICIVILCICSC